MILGAPPFNVISIFFLPFAFCVKDEKRLMKINDYFTKFMFVPIAFFFTILFSIFNLMMLPFAYLMAIYKKILLLNHARKE